MADDVAYRRPRWDSHFEAGLINEYHHPVTRSYFDRRREPRGDSSEPLRGLPVRPIWSLETEPEPRDDTYRVFDAKTASWKEVIWKSGRAPHGSRESASTQEGSDADQQRRASSASQPLVPTVIPPRRRTPLNVHDLIHQRYREKDWNPGHQRVFSSGNPAYHQVQRSYFDRWRDVEVPGQYGPPSDREKEVTWKLPPEPKKPILRSASEGTVIINSLELRRERGWQA